MKKDLEIVRQEGMMAHNRGKGISECPYPDNPQKEEWEIGWLTAENEDLQSEYYGGDPTRAL
jgi:ribosome modulation factor